MRLLSFVLLFAFAPPALAERCPAPAGASAALAELDSEARLGFLQRGMRHAARQSRIWAWSSAALFFAFGGFEFLGATHAPDYGDRVDLWVGTASLTFTLVQMTAFMPLVTIDQWALDKRLRRDPPGAGRCALVAEAERLLARDARSERIATGAAMQAATIVFNIGAALVLGIAFDRWTSATINLFSGAAIGEIQILTQPTEMITLEARYRRADLAPPPPPKRALHGLLLAPTLSHGGGGFAVGAAF